MKTIKKNLLKILLAFLPTTCFSQWTQLGNDIIGQTATENSAFSLDLSSDGTILAIGAPWNDANGTHSGSARVFQYNGTSWVQMGSDINGSNTRDNLGFCVKLSANGMSLLVGAPNEYIGTVTPPGYVKIFDWNGTNWLQRGDSLTSNNNQDQFGLSVDISANGNTVAIGIPYASINASRDGQAKVYNWTSSNWVQLGNDVNGAQDNQLTGRSVSINSSGNLLCVGEKVNSIGRVRVFDLIGSNWIPKDTIDSPEINFGRLTSMDSTGNTISIGGALGASSEGESSIYEFNGINYSQKGLSIVGDSGSDFSGFDAGALNGDGNIFVVGAPHNNNNLGQAKILQFDGSNWISLGNDIVGSGISSQFGHSASISSNGSIVAIGTPYILGQNPVMGSGVVRIYQNPVPLSSPTITIDKELIALPNPFHNIIHVKTDTKLIGSNYRIIDITGKVVATGKFYSENTSIELLNLSSGVYILDLGNTIKQSFKLIKE